jgi:hypothetical protein
MLTANECRVFVGTARVVGLFRRHGCMTVVRVIPRFEITTLGRIALLAETPNVGRERVS